MISYIKHLPLGATRYIEIACVSTDTKPTENVATGSTAIEADTGDFYLFDGSAWVKMCSIKEA